MGDFELRMELKNGEIRSVVMLGDYFIVGDVDAVIIKPLRGAMLERESLLKALPDNLDDAILNLGKNEFVNLLLGNLNN